MKMSPWNKERIIGKKNASDISYLGDSNQT
ncbi:Uncharacterised protein [Serratia marcescens]|nr:hypothetical protein AZZ98_002840 [Serratia marcescens]CUY23010.1 Uncharacterised protein [Serratia marcescens]CUY23071.1 Uncharacterised protein [Serratia marcescens]CUY24367.1 Uncharacterised protein [Serratia marcescens]CUY60119.1 Uncharacterised protein [Serratia marcescens]